MAFRNPYFSAVDVERPNLYVNEVSAIAIFKEKRSCVPRKVEVERKLEDDAEVDFGISNAARSGRIRLSARQDCKEGVGTRTEKPVRNSTLGRLHRASQRCLSQLAFVVVVRERRRRPGDLSAWCCVGMWTYRVVGRGSIGVDGIGRG